MPPVPPGKQEAISQSSTGYREAPKQGETNLAGKSSAASTMKTSGSQNPKPETVPWESDGKMKKPPYTIIAGAVAAVAILVVALFVFPGFLKKDAGNGNGAAIEEDGDVVSMGGDGLLNLTGADAESLVDPEKQDAEKDKGKDAGEAAKEEAVSDNNEKTAEAPFFVERHRSVEFPG